MTKLQISAVEGAHTGQVVVAQFNPKEISVDRAVLWQPQPNQAPGDLQFEHVDPARMFFELLFDGYEDGTSIQPYVDRLNQFSSVDGDLHRPPKVKVVWGSAAGAMPVFNAVIESVSVRYTMFAPNGVPLRATVDVSLRQAGKLMVHKTSPSH